MKFTVPLLIVMKGSSWKNIWGNPPSCFLPGGRNEVLAYGAFKNLLVLQFVLLGGRKIELGLDSNLSERLRLEYALSMVLRGGGIGC